MGAALADGGGGRWDWDQDSRGRGSELSKSFKGNLERWVVNIVFNN